MSYIFTNEKLCEAKFLENVYSFIIANRQRCNEDKEENNQD